MTVVVSLSNLVISASALPSRSSVSRSVLSRRQASMRSSLAEAPCRIEVFLLASFVFPKSRYPSHHTIHVAPRASISSVFLESLLF